MKRDKMSDFPTYELIESTPLKPQYLTIGVVKGTGVDIDHWLPDSFQEYVNKGYHLTIYDSTTFETIATKSFISLKGRIQINNYSFGNIDTLVVIEDRSDLNSIDLKTSVGYISFRQKFGNEPVMNKLGEVPFQLEDGTTTYVPYFGTGIL